MLAAGGLRAPVAQQRSSCVPTMSCYPRLRQPPGRSCHSGETLSFCTHPLWGQSVGTQCPPLGFHPNQLALYLRVTLWLTCRIRSLELSQKLCFASEQVTVN